MKPLRLLFLVTFAVGIATASLCASDAASVETTAKAKLQVSIGMPNTPDRSLEENSYAGQAFATALTKTFKRQGYPREIVILRTPTAAQAETPLLKLQVVEWRSTIPGEINCAFDAVLIHGSEAQELGRIFASEPLSSDQDQSMKNVAAAALKKLCQQLGSSPLLAAD